MVTLGSMHPVFQQGFEAAGYDDSMNLRSVELALNGVDEGDMVESAVGSSAMDPAEERAMPVTSSKPRRRNSILVSAPPSTTAPEAATTNSSVRDREQKEPPPSAARRGSMYTQSSTHRLFRAASPEAKKQQWNPPRQVSSNEAAGGVGGGVAPISGGDSRLRASSWHSSSDHPHTRSPRRSGDDISCNSHKHSSSSSSSSSSSDRFFPKRRGRDDREILDGSDVLQQISNVTSTEPSNEREVFVGGLRESEDAVHITEEELATYFAKFGVIESVSINRDDRTQRGRGFAFVKFFQEAAALNAVVADASTHVIRGTTVSVQWSRGAKGGSGGGVSDRPRRRNSTTAITSSGNSSSPSRGSNRSSSKLGMFSHKSSSGRGGGSGGGVPCGASCNHGFSPMHGRNMGHMHMPTGGGGVSYGFGGGHHGDHRNQPMVCVVVPAQRAAALGLAPHPARNLRSTSSSSAKASSTRDSHFSPSTQQQSSSAAAGGHPGYPSQARSHSQSVGGGGYGHHDSSPRGSIDYHHGGMMTPPHHLSPSSGHHTSPSSAGHLVSPSSGQFVSPNMGWSYGAPPSIHMPPMHRELRGRTEPSYSLAGDYVSAGSGGGGSGSPSYAEYERSSLQRELSLHSSSSYVSSEWGYDDARGSRGSGVSAAQGLGRSQSPPAMMRNSLLVAPSGGRNGGGAPRPPSASPREYDGRYSSTHYSGRGLDGFPVAGVGSANGGVATRRRSESSAMVGHSSMQRECLAIAASYYNPVDDIGKDDFGYGREYDRSYGEPSRLP